jgi:hypothetical protein
MALSNAERQRKYKENLKAQAANNAAFTEHRHILQELTGRLERAVERVEHRVTAHFDPAIFLSMPPHEEERLMQLRRLQPFDEDGSLALESQDHPFLGMSAQQWLTMPEELLAVFGLVDAVAEWKRRAAKNLTRVSLQPDGNTTVQHWTQGTTEGEALSHAEEPAGGVLTDQADTLPLPVQRTDYASLFEAFQAWLKDSCPFKAGTKDRAQWAVDRKFPHDGTEWFITIERPWLASGETALAVTFTGDDGRVLEPPPCIQKENQVRSPEVLSD